jgi:hypothetical protein
VWLEKTQETLALARRGAFDQIVVNALVDGERGIFLRPKRLRKNRDRNNPRLTRGALRLPERSGEGRGSVHDSATETNPPNVGVRHAWRYSSSVKTKPRTDSAVPRTTRSNSNA